MKKTIFLLITSFLIFFALIFVPKTFGASLFPNGIFGSDGVFGPGGVFGNSAILEKNSFQATLTGSEEVPPVISSASAKAYFNIKSVASPSAAIKYRLQIKNGQRVTMAHIHCGTLGQNGPVVAVLFGPVASGFSGNLLIQATLTNSSIVANTCSPAITNINELISALRAGKAYVNAHSVTYPAGEIRGQIK